MAEYETLLYEEDGGVAVVTLNRPDVHNAFNARMRAELPYNETGKLLRRVLRDELSRSGG